ncbi:oxidoreductase [Actinomadura keratinilytica]|uniref:Oxidoreductase n=2 Tax=Actinomadura keratinilytica TaxID=547461 RepID=A0ABP7ZFE3_9ACTN
MIGMARKWNAADVPDQHGRVAVVTGANTGLGFDTARVLAERGATVVLAVRDTGKGERAAARIAETAPEADVSVRHLDLTSLESVRDAAREVRSRHPKIDLLINNAGVMFTPKGTTRDGFELQFGTNHLGHFAFTGLLLEALLPVPGSRVVTVSSAMHRVRARIDFDDLGWRRRRYDRVAAYARSKLANLLFTYELQRRLAAADAGTIAVAAHPGFAATELIRNLPAAVRLVVSTAVAPVFAQSAEMGALPTLRAATDPDVRGGRFYGPDGPFEGRGHPKPVSSSRLSHDRAVQRRLWEVSEELTGVRYPL